MEIFNKQYRFSGMHAVRVDALTSNFNEKLKFFNRNVDVYIVAPLVGFLYGRKAQKDYTKNPTTNETYNQNVMGDMVIYSQPELLYNYQLIMLLDTNYEPDEEVRVNKAFRCWDDPADMELFDSYVRGGVDVLYEKLIENENNPENYINRLYQFLEEFQERFNETIDREYVKKLL